MYRRASRHGRGGPWKTQSSHIRSDHRCSKQRRLQHGGMDRQALGAAPGTSAEGRARSIVGLWRLNHEKSKVPSLNSIVEENRRITKIGEKFTVNIRRVYTKNGSPKETVYQFVCDGKHWKWPLGTWLTCVQKGPNVTEGYYTSPLRFYTREVSHDGQTLTISTFEADKRDKLITLEVFDRLLN
jgi:hypothetical protein